MLVYIHITKLSLGRSLHSSGLLRCVTEHLVSFYTATRRNGPEDRRTHLHCCNSLKTLINNSALYKKYSVGVVRETITIRCYQYHFFFQHILCAIDASRILHILMSVVSVFSYEFCPTFHEIISLCFHVCCFRTQFSSLKKLRCIHDAFLYLGDSYISRCTD